MIVRDKLKTLHTDTQARFAGAKLARCESADPAEAEGAVFAF